MSDTGPDRRRPVLGRAPASRPLRHIRPRYAGLRLLYRARSGTRRQRARVHRPRSAAGRALRRAGREFVLLTDRIGNIGPGSNVYFRGIAVGEVAGYDPPGIDKALRLHIFVRDPFASYVYDRSRFWNASGISLKTTSQGFQVPTRIFGRGPGRRRCLRYPLRRTHRRTRQIGPCLPALRRCRQRRERHLYP